MSRIIRLLVRANERNPFGGSHDLRRGIQVKEEPLEIPRTERCYRMGRRGPQKPPAGPHPSEHDISWASSRFAPKHLRCCNCPRAIGSMVRSSLTERSTTRSPTPRRNGQALRSGRFLYAPSPILPPQSSAVLDVETNCLASLDVGSRLCRFRPTLLAGRPVGPQHHLSPRTPLCPALSPALTRDHHPAPRRPGTPGDLPRSGPGRRPSESLRVKRMGRVRDFETSPSTRGTERSLGLPRFSGQVSIAVDSI